jgi:hypothetical protein
MKLRGDMMRSTRNCELEALGIQVIIEQAAHELKYGDPRVKLVYKLIMNVLTNFDAIMFGLSKHILLNFSTNILQFHKPKLYKLYFLQIYKLENRLCFKNFEKL